MRTKLYVLATFVLVLQESYGIHGSSGPRKSGTGSRNCGRISGFIVSTVPTKSSTITVTHSSWTNKNATMKFEYIGNYTGHEKCLSNCDPCHPRPCTCRPECECLPMKDYPSVGRCVKKKTPLPDGVERGMHRCKNKEGKKKMEDKEKVKILSRRKTVKEEEEQQAEHRTT
uniref:Putative secreted protein n=1 Tax=Ixodes ricinus TaxID=34613 RepID=A0A0K8R992_IXORI